MSNLSRRGAGTSQNTGYKYWGVSSGKIVRRVTEDTPGAKARVLKKGPNEGKTVYEIQQQFICGELLDIQVTDKKSEYTPNWSFYINTSTEPGGVEVEVVKMPYSSSYAANILKALPNMNQGEDIQIYGYNYTKKGESDPTIGLCLQQWDEKNNKFSNVEWYYTKDDMKGMPDWEKIMLKGKQVWDSTKQLEFLEAMVESDIRPHLEGLEQNSTTTKETEPKDSADSENEGEEAPW